MGIQRRVGFFGLLMPGKPSAYTAASAAWLFGNSPMSLKRFVEDCTGGEISLSVQTAALMPTTAQADAILKMPLGRVPRLAACAAVARANGWDLSQFDALAFGIWGGVCDTGAWAVWDDPADAPGRWIPAMLFDEDAMHNMICHELCHSLGLDHSFWLAANTGYVFGEYGDPTDVMSGSGGVPGAFTPTVDTASGIAATGKYWTCAGPGIGMATLWRYLPGFPAAQPWVRVLDPLAPPSSLFLERAGAAGSGRPWLAAMPVPGGWWTFEYRPAVGWDHGLYSAAVASDSPGIVVHWIGDLGVQMPPIGYPKYQQVQYLATIPVPPLGDTDWDNGQIGVRYVQHTDDGVTVHIGRSTNPDVSFAVSEPEYLAETRSTAGIERVAFGGENCLPGDVVTERISAYSRIIVTAQSSGFSDPRFRFRVKGMDVGSDAALGTLDQGSVKLPAVPVSVPASKFTSTVQARNISVVWYKNGNTLTLEFPTGDGRYAVPVQVLASEAGGGGATSQHQEDIEVRTQWINWPDSVLDKIRHCTRVLKRLYIERELRPGPPIPIDGPDWSRFTALEVYGHLAALRDAQAADPRTASGIRQMVAEGYGLHPEAVAEVERMLGRSSE